jgi:Holin of 3TMs, for gene-transfer release
MAADPITAALNIGGQLIDRLWPDQEKKDQAKLALMEMAQKGELTELTVRGEIVKAEAASEHWLAANWRPILMLTFGGLIVARWFGWAAPNLSESEYLKLWDIVELGIGGYVIGRSAEKVLPNIAQVFKK